VTTKTNWVVAVTTAPRQDCTLSQCCQSLVDCGWSPTVFAEPDSTITSYLTIHNEKKLGVWHNWLSASKWCIENTDAEVIMTVQDDCLFHPDSKQFTESILWPTKDTGFISLYTSRKYSFDRHRKLRPPGLYRVHTNSLWGACALVFPRKVLAEVINSSIAKVWLGAPAKTANRRELYEKRKENPHTIANSDTAIGLIINHMLKSMWFVDPSPVTHIARYSTCGHGGNDGNRNCLRPADHNTSLFDQVPIKGFS